MGAVAGIASAVVGSGALNGVIGSVAGGVLGGSGGAGGILGGIGSAVAGLLGGGNKSGGAEGIAGLMKGFAPADVMNAAANLIGSITGQSVNQGAQSLHHDHGMPKFMMNAIKQAVQQAMQQMQQPTDPQAQNTLNDGTQDDANDTIQDWAKQFVDAVLKELKQQGAGGANGAQGAGGAGGAQGAGDAGGAQGAGGAGGAQGADGADSGGGSWLEALAKALGKIADKQAQKLKDMSNSMGGKDATPSQQTELQAASQMMNMMMQTFADVIKTIGSAMGTMAQKS